MNIHNKAILSYLAFFAGVILAFTALFLPPVGEIALTVISVISEFLVLAGALAGIDLAFDQKMMHFEGRLREEIMSEMEHKSESNN